MKTLFLLLAVAAATTVYAQTEPRTDTIRVKGMSCGMCERRIEKNIGKLSGIRSIEADVEQEMAVVVFDPSKTSKDAVEQAISKIGYSAGSYEADKVARDHLPGCCNPNQKH